MSPLYHEGVADGKESANACKKIIQKFKHKKEISDLVGKCLESEALVVGTFRAGQEQWKQGFFDGFVDRAKEIMEEKC